MWTTIIYYVINKLIDIVARHSSKTVLLVLLICFLIMNNAPTYDDLAVSFRTFVTFDIILIVASLVSLFIEMLLILRKGSDK